jgi:hypothetical protein
MLILCLAFVYIGILQDNVFMIVVDDFDFSTYLLLNMAHRRLFVLFYFPFWQFSSHPRIFLSFSCSRYLPDFPVPLLSLPSPAGPAKAKAVGK